MIEYVCATFLVVGFILILKISRLVEKSVRVIEISRQALAMLRNAALSEDAKETAMQSHAKNLLGLFLLITIGGAAALVLPFVVIWMLDRLQLVSLDAVMDVALSWSFLSIATVAVVLAYLIRRTP